MRSLRLYIIGCVVSALLFFVSCAGEQVGHSDQVGASDSLSVANSFYNAPKSPKSSSGNKNNNQQKSRGDAICSHSRNKGKLYRHEHYSLSYSEEDEQAEWVAYELTRDELYGNAKRQSSFIKDPIIETESASPYEYQNSGYTRGHLAPAGDMKFDHMAMKECFFTSNISPQTKKFNSGCWNDLEMQVRYWAKRFNRVYVVTGPVLTDKGLEKITYLDSRDQEKKGHVTIPKRFYKIIYDFSYEGKEKMIAFIIPQEGAGRDYFKYATTVDEVEEVTGIDFFTNLSNAEEGRLEGTFDVSQWPKYDNPYN